jgi:hypothetical protein
MSRGSRHRAVRFRNGGPIYGTPGVLDVRQVHVGPRIGLLRFYEPNLQRWINPDPLEEMGGINLYAFVRNSAVTRFDAFGLSACTDACSKQNLADLAGCGLLGLGSTIIGGAICYFAPPLCAAAAKTVGAAITACLAVAETKYASCLASCIGTGRCPPPPWGPMPVFQPPVGTR